MTGTMKFVFFLVALATMTCFAVASVAMAQGHGWLASGLFVVALLMTTAGFVTKSRVMRRNQ